MGSWASLHNEEGHIIPCNTCTFGVLFLLSSFDVSGALALPGRVHVMMAQRVTGDSGSGEEETVHTGRGGIMVAFEILAAS